MRVALGARALAGACVLIMVAATPALASGSPNIGITNNAPASVLYGDPATITLTASNTASEPFGYNLSFRDVLPPGVTYVTGSSPASAGEPQVLTDAPTLGSTTLIWSNVSDLSPGSSYGLSFQVNHDHSHYDVGSNFVTDGSAYLNTNPRWVAKFNADGTPNGPSTNSFTGSADATANTQITAIKVTKSEPSPQGEILRGDHQQQTVYTLRVTNNSVNPTANVRLEDYLPADLEFLGCGGPSSDNTTNAPTNPGSSNEYPGSGAMTSSTLAPCTAPDIVETLQNPLPPSGLTLSPGVYTHVQWTNLGVFAPAETRTFYYRAAVPLRENTMTWSGGTTPAITGLQGSNLDNNSGPETRDGQPIDNSSRVQGDYNPGQPDAAPGVFDSFTLHRVAKDLRIIKSGSSGVLSQGQITTWSLRIDTSEYRYTTTPSVTDTVPTGLCPLGPQNYEQNPESQCDPVAGQAPSIPYDSVSEQADGSFKINWSSSLPQLLAPSTSHTITFPTRTRRSYRSSYADTSPVLANDGIANNVDILGQTNTICGPVGGALVDCSSGGSLIDHDNPSAGPSTDHSSAGQSSTGPTLQKEVAASYPSSHDCRDATYAATTASYRPGDHVCWHLRITFPSMLDTKSQSITDFLPPGFTPADASSTGCTSGDHTCQPTPANTVSIASFDPSANPGVLSWTLGNSNDATPGQVFDVVVDTVLGPPDGRPQGDVTGNLLKFASLNTAGRSFPLRDRVDVSLDVPTLALQKGVQQVDRGGTKTDPAMPYPANHDHVAVEGGDLTTFRIDVTNTGSTNAVNTTVWDLLPSGIGCPQVQAASLPAGATCVPAGGGVSDHLVFTGVTVPAASGGPGTTTLTYQVQVPAGVSPGLDFVNTAGVRDFQSTDNTGGTQQYYPASNIDATVTNSNALPANDPSDIYTRAATVVKTRTPSKVTIGDTINYTVTTTIPHGTTVYGNPVVTDALGTQQTYVPGSLNATLDGNDVTAGVTVSSNTITAPLGTPSYTPPAAGDGQLVLTFRATVSDVYPLNKAGGTIPNTGVLSYNDQTGASHTQSGSVTTPIVEPNISVHKIDDSGGPVSPGQHVHYTLDVANASGATVSTAHNVSVVDHVPVGLTPLDSGGNPVADGGTVPSDNGTWDATARTITWSEPSLAPAAGEAVHYTASVDSPPVSGTQLKNSATVTVASLDSGGRTSTSPGSPPGYSATSTDTLAVAGPTLTKSVTPTSATIGDNLNYHVQVTMPANTKFDDATVLDTLPDSVDFNSPGFLTATCTSGCLGSDASVTTFPAGVNANGTTTIGWYLGQLSDSPNARIYDLTFVAHVRDTHRNGGAQVLKGQALVNSAQVDTDRTQKFSTPPTAAPPSSGFDDHSAPATATAAVIEPNLTIAKSDSGDSAGKIAPGGHLTYSLAVKNTGNAPAYDVSVTDQPAPQLTNVVAVGGASFITQAWTASDHHMAWTIPGPIAPGGTITLTYTADVAASASLHNGDHAINTASIPSYWGVPAAQRSSDGFTYRHYAGPSSTVNLTLEFPALRVVKNTGQAGYPNVGNDEVGQPFPWHVVTTNTASTAAANSVAVNDTLPPNWSYVAHSAVITPGGAQLEPTIVHNPGGDVLSWSNVGGLAPGASVTVDFQATPSLAAAVTPGLGNAHPSINAATASGTDTTGAAGNADGPYQANTATASAILHSPVLGITKTPKGATVKAGSGASFHEVVHNSGDAPAHNVVVSDVMEAGLHYAPGSATASPSTGFSEASVSPNTPGPGQTTVRWTIASLPAGASVDITTPVDVAANEPSGSTLHNVASTTSDETPAPVSDTGYLNVITSADIGLTKTDDAPPSGVVAGTNMTYTLTAHNYGPSDAQSVSITDPLPAQESFVSADPGCAIAGGTVTCTAGTLPAGGSAVFHVSVHVDPATPKGSHISNTAAVHSSTPDTEPSPHSPNSTDNTLVDTSADVSISKTASSSTVNGGDPVTYTLTAHNNGPSDAQNVHVNDPLPSDVTFQSVHGPAGANCSASGNTVDCALGALPAGASQTVTITAVAKGSPPPPSTPGTGDHQLTISKVESEVDLNPGETRTTTLSCSNGGYMADGSVEVLAVDQGTGTLASVDVLESRSVAPGTYQFTERNNASGRAQTKTFGLCLPPTTSTDNGDVHNIVVGATKTITTPTLSVGRHTYTIDCGCGNVAISPGFRFLSGNGRIVTSEASGSTWKFTVDVTSPGQVELSARPLDTQVSTANGHTHNLLFTYVQSTITVPAGQSITAQVICPDDAKGMTATYDLSNGIVSLGNDPQPKTRVFHLLNTGPTDATATIDLVCIHDRTGPEIDPLAPITNTATVSSDTADPDTSNNQGSACIVILRAVGSVAPGGSGGSGGSGGGGSGGGGSGGGGAGPAAPAPSPHAVISPHSSPAVAPLVAPTGTIARGSTAATVTLSCLSASACQGTVVLTLPPQTRSAHPARIVLGSSGFTIRPGKSATVTVKIPARLRRLLRNRHGTRAAATTTVGSGAGTRTVTTMLTLR